MLRPQRSKPTKDMSTKEKLVEFAFRVASLFNAIVPKGNIISMCSTPDFSDNARAFYDYLQNNLQRGVLDNHIIVWHVRDPKTARNVANSMGYHNVRTIFINRNRPISFFWFCLSDFLITTHGLYSMIPITNKQHSIYLCHGMAIKNFAFLYENDIRLGVTLGDHYFVTSSFYRVLSEKMFRVNAERIHITGLPRNDFIHKPLSDLQNSALESLGENLVLYLPTYRKSNGANKSNGSNINSDILRFGGTREEWISLSNALKSKNMNIVIKPHPMEQSVENDFMNGMENVHIIDDKWLLNNGLILNQLFQKSCLLITDYSSVYIDYLLVDKPILLFLPDEKQYLESRGLVFDKPEDFIACPVITSFSEIQHHLNSQDAYRDARKRINSKLNEVEIGEACGNVLNVINEAYKK